jgi:hypothetical protein
MGKFLRISSGVPRSFTESGSPVIYNQTLEVVASGAGAGQINGPITSGTNITLPLGQTYVGDELRVSLNGLLMSHLFDYNTPNSTQINFTFTLVVTDQITFFIDRSA